MRTLIKKLARSEYDRDQWQLHNVFIPSASIDGAQINYQGDVLESVVGQGHTVEFKSKTWGHRPSQIDIPLYVSANALVEVFINDKLVKNFPLTTQPDTQPHIDRLTVDTTNWTEPVSESSIKLEISYRGAQGKTIILLDSDQLERGPRILQPWSTPYAIKAILFNIFAWGSLLGLTIFIIANTQSFVSDVVRFWGTVVTVLIWFFGVFGFTDLVKLPIRAGVRWLYGWSRPRRPEFLTALSIIFVLAGIGVGTVVYCSYIRYRYTALVNETLEKRSEDSLRRAFIQQPWRKEAQIIFEVYGAAVAANSTDNFRKFINRFISNPEVNQTIANEMNRKALPYCLNKDNVTALSDPVVWYASILPEAEEETDTKQKKEAIRILASRNGPSDIEAKLLKKILEIAISTDQAQIETFAAELNKLLTENNNYSSEALHTYQVGWDTLAQLAIAKCIAAKKANNSEVAQKAVDEAIFFFKRVMSIRAQLSNKNKSLWHRPPSKLALYQIFHYYSPTIKPEAAKAIDDAIFKPCPEFKEAFEKNFKDKEEYHEYFSESIWLRGTVLNDEYITYIKDILMKNGWRY
jgi:hypothetical protein